MITASVYLTDFTARDGIVLIVVMVFTGLSMGLLARLIR